MTLLVLPKPSRYDRANNGILVGPARTLVNETLGVGNYDCCYAEDFERRRAGFSHIILSGQESLDKMHLGQTLSSARGFVWHLGQQKLVATFWPQDCVDVIDRESTDDEDEDDKSGNNKDDAKTARKNFRFWFKQDCAKLLRGEVPETDGRIQISTSYQMLDGNSGADYLAGKQGCYLYLDIESHPDTDTINCLSFACNNEPVYTVCIYDYKNQLQPHAVRFMAALQRAFYRNTIVIHNAAFDLPFLHIFHGMSFGDQIEDTMLMGHRIWPEAEKSLAHQISLWINAPYHKSEGGTWHPRSWKQMDQLMRYNSKDVYRLRSVHQAQWHYVNNSGDQGLIDSVQSVNAAIFPYLWTSLHGLPINGRKLVTYRQQQSQNKADWLKVVEIMAGYPLNPGSSDQIGKYLTEYLHYDVLSKTETGAPCCDESALYKYLAKYGNPIIRAFLKYKSAQKIESELGFKFYVQLKGR